MTKKHRSMDMVYTEGSRMLDVQHEDYDNYLLQATSETGRIAKGYRQSTTWNWEHKGRKYRVQVQVTEL